MASWVLLNSFWDTEYDKLDCEIFLWLHGNTQTGLSLIFFIRLSFSVVARVEMLTCGFAGNHLHNSSLIYTSVKAANCLTMQVNNSFSTFIFMTLRPPLGHSNSICTACFQIMLYAVDRLT
jgi:hypothetical protein